MMDGDFRELIPLTKHLAIDAAWVGLTVVEAVRRAFPELSAREVFKKTRTGEVERNHGRCQPLDTLAEGDLVTVILYRPAQPFAKPVEREDEYITTPAGPFRIVREDEDLLVVSKPPGCASHPALRHSGDTLIERVRHYLNEDPAGEFCTALANRLDIETSGIVLIGKNRQTQRKLGFSLQRGKLEKRYLALVAGWPEDEGEITTPLERRPDSRDLQNYPEGHPRRAPRMQSAHTRYRTLFRAQNPLRAALLEVELLTGRTHQIRRHLRGVDHPIGHDRRHGDPEFNRELAEICGLDRMFLHAHYIGLEHPISREPLEIYSGLPQDLVDCLRALGTDVSLLEELAKKRG